MTSNATVNAPDTDYIIPDLDPDTEYFFTVTAINSVDEGPASDIWNETTDSLPPPNAPTLNATAGNAKVTLRIVQRIFRTFKV